jgi:hypothetical protein
LVKGDSSRYGGCQWRARGLQSETPARRSHPHWVSPDCRWRWPVEHPHQLLGRRWMCRCRTPQRITNSSSVRKKFPTSVCRRSTSSTRKTLRHLWLDLNKLLGAADADVAAADAASALADAAGEAAGAVAAVVVAVAAAAAGDVAAGRRRDFLNCRHSAGFAPTGRDCASGYSRADVCDRAPQSKRPIPRLTTAAGSGGRAFPRLTTAAGSGGRRHYRN